MAQKEYLNKEQDIHNYLWQTSRIYKLLSKDATEKLQILKTIQSELQNMQNKEVNFFNELNTQFNVLMRTPKQGVLSRLFSKSQVSSDVESFELKVKSLSSSLRQSISDITTNLTNLTAALLSKIKRQKMLLLEDIQISAEEEEAITQIKGMPPFQSLNPAEQKLLDELVWTQKKEIDSIVSCLNYYHNSLVTQEKLAETFAVRISDYKQEWDKWLSVFSSFSFNNLSQSAQEKLIAQLKSGVQNVPASAFYKFVEGEFELVEGARTKSTIFTSKTSFINQFDEYLAWEKSANDFLTKATDKLIDEAKRILSEKEEIKTYFNKNDLEELRSLIQVISKQEKYKFDRMKTLLTEKRAITDNLGLHQFIAVHLTDTFPLKGILKPGGQFEATGRNTLHFSINAPVASHELGSWAGKRFAVLIPLEKIIDRIINLLPQDSWIFGDLVLPPGSEILMLVNPNEKEIPLIRSDCAPFVHLSKDIDFIKKNTGNADLRVYDVAKYSLITEAVHERIVQRGYRLQSHHATGGFSDLVLATKFDEIADELKKTTGLHVFTDWNYFDDVIYYASKALKEKFDLKICQTQKENIEKWLPKFEELTKKMVSPEEKAARARMITLITKLYSELNQRCPSKQQAA
jgi:hypothetical protein